MSELTEPRAAALLREVGFPVPGAPGWADPVLAACAGVVRRPGEPVPTWAVGEERVRHRDPSVPVTHGTLVCSCGGRACVHVAAVLLSLALEDPARRQVLQAPAWELALAGLTGSVPPTGSGRGELWCELRRPAPGRVGLEPELNVLSGETSVRAPRRVDELQARVGTGTVELEVHAAWLALDQARRLERGHRPVLVRHLTRALLGPLARMGRVTLEGVRITISARPLTPRLVAEPSEGGALELRWTPPLRVLWPEVGVALTAEGELRPLSEDVTPETCARLLDALPPVPASDVKRFVHRVVLDQGLPVQLPAHLDPVARPTGLVVRLALAELESDLLVRLELVYRAEEGDVTVRPTTPGTTARVPGSGLVRRDLEREAAVLRRFEDDTGGADGELRLSGDAALDWLRVRLPELARRYEVHGDDRLLRLKVRGTLSPKVRFDEGEDWFDLDVGFELGGRAVPAGPVLASWARGERFHRLDDGSLAELPLRWLERHGKAVDELAEVRRAQRGLGTWHAWLASGLMREHGVGERWLGVVDRREGVARIDPPPGLRAVLRLYQRQGLDWLCFLRDHGLHGVLADEMGLGKTVQALAAILEGRRPGDPPALVVAPTSLLHVWTDEAARFAPELRVLAWHGARRHERSLADADLVVTTYALLRRDERLLSGVPWSWAVLDEAQHVKNPASQTSRAARRLQARHRLALTGTPLQNDLVEIWSLFRFLMPGLLGSRSAFHARYAVAQQRRDQPGAAVALDDLARRIRPFVLRRRKAEVATELPPKTEITLRIELSEPERELYDVVRNTVRDEVRAARREPERRRSAMLLEGLTRLRQACCHPALLPFPEARAVRQSAKLDALLELLDDALPAGSRALVFSQWVRLLDEAAAGLDARGVRYLRLDGATRDRAAVVAAFQAEDGPGVLLVSVQAGGTGLTLTAADLVIHLDPWWNPAVEDQATDRAHRLGQTRPVTVYRLLAADTVEERVAKLAEHKRTLIARAVDLPTLDVSALTTDDLLALL